MQTLIFLVFMIPNNAHTEKMESWNQCLAVRDSLYEAAKESNRVGIYEKELYCFNVNTKKRSYYGEN